MGPRLYRIRQSRKCGARIYSSIDFVEYSNRNLLQKLKETFYLKSLLTSWEGYVSSEAPLALGRQ